MLQNLVKHCKNKNEQEALALSLDNPGVIFFTDDTTSIIIDGKIFGIGSSRLFIGTQSEYNIAVQARQIPYGAIVIIEPEPAVNEIWYTSIDCNIINLNQTEGGDISIVSNEYNNDRGVFTFNGPIESIANGTFSDCYPLTSVAIPNGVISIGNNAFSGCSLLTSVAIPNSIMRIGSSAFAGCSSLTSINIPDSVKLMGIGAFQDCTSLTSVVILGGVSSIPSKLFYGCTALTSVVIHDGVKIMGSNAFAGCTSLTSINIPNSVTNIASGAFYSCRSLISVTIGESVTTIEDNAFRNCLDLSYITCKAITPPTLGAGNNLATVIDVYVPAESVDLYKNATNWSYYARKIQPIQ